MSALPFTCGLTLKKPGDAISLIPVMIPSTPANKNPQTAIFCSFTIPLQETRLSGTPFMHRTSHRRILSCRLVLFPGSYGSDPRTDPRNYTKSHEATRTNSNRGGRPVRLFAKPSLGLLDFQFCFDEIFGA